MTDALLLIGIVAAYFAALAVMPRLTKNVNKRKWKTYHDSPRGRFTVTYDPSEDPEKIMKGEIESYFD